MYLCENSKNEKKLHIDMFTFDKSIYDGSNCNQ